MTSFKRMTRGIKLLVEHLFDPINSALQTLTGSGVPLAQYEKQLGTFRVSFNFPVANNIIYGSTSGGGYGRKSILTVPFILPPLQDQFGSNENLIDGYELMEISVGQDTRGEGAAIKSAVSGEIGYLSMGEAFAFDLTIQSKQKNPDGYDSFSNQVFSMSIPEIALINSYSRLNPHVQSGISIPFNPNDSYLIQIMPIEETLVTPKSVVNLFITLKFKSRLRERDLLGIQNQTPKYPRNFLLQAAAAPVGNTPIEAASATGVNTGFKMIDSFIDRRLRGGYKKTGLSYAQEGLANDAAYEVISVPMFGSWPHVSGGTRYATFEKGNDLPYETLPWVDLAGGFHETMDRAIIPINYPLTIHHVIIAANYTGGSGEVVARPLHTVSPGYKNEVGVGIMSGHRGDDIQVQQVAYVDWLPSTLASKTIDRGDYNNFGTGTPQTQGYSWDLISCPMTGVVAGKGYTPQGQPIFTAAGIDGTSARTNVAATTPKTVGAEQVLDIRWKISTGAVSPATWAQRQSIIGYGGHWVYLICKKTVV